MTIHQTTFLLRAAACVLVAGVICLVAGAPARADFGIVDGTTSLTLSTTQAGAHPDVTTAFKLNTKTVAGRLKADGSSRNIAVELPPGVVGNPAAAPTCTETQLVDGVSGCPTSTQVGISTISLLFPNGFPFSYQTPVYNLKPGAGQVAVFGFRVLFAFVHIVVNVRTGSDYGVTATIKDIPQTITMVGSSLTLWGVPADPRHDAQRYVSILLPPGAPSGESPTPFMTNPTSCAGPLSIAVRAESWQEPGHLVSATGPAPAITGCDKVRFDPSISVRPDTFQAGAPAGYDIGVHVPQDPNPDGNESATLRDAAVTLPEGVAVSPSSADGLGACSQAQVDLHSPGAVTCPDTSKLGTVRIDTPALPHPLEGSIYLAEQGDRPGGSNPFGSMLALYLVAEGDGVTVKLAGKIEADPATGRLTTTFADNPQLPFRDMKLRFHGGPRASLVNPSVCGTATSTAALTPHSGDVPVTVTDAFEITGCGDPNRFAPGFSAGTLSTQAGASTPFTLTFSRTDQDATLGTISVDMPKGLLGRIASVPVLCSDAQAPIGTCPAGSRIGSTTTAAGPGSQPFYLPGSVYLTGPYKGAPFGLSIVVPAIAGPFNLGTVVVRAAIFVDPVTAAIRVVSDPLPTILQGIPLQIRKVNVNVDRPGFMVNPTNCDPSQIGAAIQSTAGAVANVWSRFQVGDCAALPFAPKMAMRLTNRSETTDGRHPGLDVFVTQGAGGANLKQVVTKLPLSLALDPENAQALCEYADGLKGNCPRSSEIGTAEAVSPLLNRHLYGKVYFVKGVRFNSKGQAIRTLPTLLVQLRGEINIDLRATSNVDDEGRLVTTFANVPDAAISGFRLQLRGGKHGILVVTHGKDVCSGKQITAMETDGQNGKTHDASVTMKTPCGGSSARSTRATRRAKTRKSASVRRS